MRCPETTLATSPAKLRGNGWHQPMSGQESCATDFAMYRLLEDYGVLGNDVWHSTDHLMRARAVMPSAVFQGLIEQASEYSKIARRVLAVLHQNPVSRSRAFSRHPPVDQAMTRRSQPHHGRLFRWHGQEYVEQTLRVL